MQKVLGIGGLFFRSNDPDGLAQWYADHLGVDLVPDNYDDPCWQQQAGRQKRQPETVFTKALHE